MKKYTLIMMIMMVMLGISTPAYAEIFDESIENCVIPDEYCEFDQPYYGSDSYYLIGYNGPFAVNVTLPSTHNGLPVTDVKLNKRDASLFSGELYIPPTIKNIYEGSFSGSNITKLYITRGTSDPTDYLWIMYNAFNDCTNLEGIYAYRGCQFVNRAFNNCWRLNSIYLYRYTSDYHDDYCLDSGTFHGCYGVETIHYTYYGGNEEYSWFYDIDDLVEDPENCDYVFQNDKGDVVEFGNGNSLELSGRSVTWTKVRKSVTEEKTPEDTKKEVVEETPEDTKEEVVEETPVVEKKVKVKSIKLNKKTAVVKKGRTIKLKAKFNPTNATNKNVTWKSSNKKIATVDKNGKVKTKKKGTVVITCTTKDGKKTAKCKVKVR